MGILLFVITLAATLLVQGWLKRTYSRWSKVENTSGLTGAQTARAILGPIIIVVGAMLGAAGLFQVGLVLFAAAVIFQLVTLPVEFDASRRALSQMEALGLATTGDVGGSRQVLNAAAMTYVAAAAASVAYLLYYLSMFMGGDE